MFISLRCAREGELHREDDKTTVPLITLGTLPLLIFLVRSPHKSYHSRITYQPTGRHYGHHPGRVALGGEGHGNADPTFRLHLPVLFLIISASFFLLASIPSFFTPPTGFHGDATESDVAKSPFSHRNPRVSLQVTSGRSRLFRHASKPQKIEQGLCHRGRLWSSSSFLLPLFFKRRCRQMDP